MWYARAAGAQGVAVVPPGAALAPPPLVPLRARGARHLSVVSQLARRAEPGEKYNENDIRTEETHGSIFTLSHRESEHSLRPTVGIK